MRTSEAVSGMVAARIISASALSLPVRGQAPSLQCVHMIWGYSDRKSSLRRNGRRSRLRLRHGMGWHFWSAGRVHF